MSCAAPIRRVLVVLASVWAFAWAGASPALAATAYGGGVPASVGQLLASYYTGSSVTLTVTADASSECNGVAKSFDVFVRQGSASSVAGQVVVASGWGMVTDGTGGSEARTWGGVVVPLLSPSPVLYLVLVPLFSSCPWYSDGGSALVVTGLVEVAAPTATAAPSSTPGLAGVPSDVARTGDIQALTFAVVVLGGLGLVGVFAAALGGVHGRG